MTVDVEKLAAALENRSKGLHTWADAAVIFAAAEAHLEHLRNLPPPAKSTWRVEWQHTPPGIRQQSPHYREFDDLEVAKLFLEIVRDHPGTFNRSITEIIK